MYKSQLSGLRIRYVASIVYTIHSTYEVQMECTVDDTTSFIAKSQENQLTFFG